MDRGYYPGDDEDDSFYVGPTHARIDLGGGRETQVVSWVAPAAAAFFERHYEAGLVKVRRHLDSDGHDLTRAWDEWLTDPDGIAFDGDPVAQTEEPSTASTAEDALRERLLAPRTPLTALLGTLQPEQYALVAADPASSLVVQGHAGTGKTVVATHRAAWLTHPRPPGPVTSRRSSASWLRRTPSSSARWGRYSPRYSVRTLTYRTSHLAAQMWCTPHRSSWAGRSPP